MSERHTWTAAGFPPLALALFALAWASLLVWEASPYGRYLHHGDWTALGLPATICAAVPAGAWLIPGVLYAGGWMLMSAAMMLPTTMPLIRLFDRMIHPRTDRVMLHILLIAGYLLAWAGFGVAAHLVDRALHAGLGGWPWLAANAWAPGAAVLALAGGFQFSSLKYHCLDKCRTPLSFLMSHWHGPRPYREALVLGLSHGVYCVGCCWALMLLLFVLGTGSLGWMFALAVIMATEKNHRWGRRIAAPLGGALLVIALFITVRGLA